MTTWKVAMTAPRLALLVCMSLPSLAAAQDMGLSRAVELPAHRVLMETKRGAALAPFETDGCSGGMSTIWSTIAVQFPDFAKVHGALPPWEACCQVHDVTYHRAGDATDAPASFEARKQADEALRACVVDTGERDLPRIAEAYGVSEDLLRQTYRGIGDAMYLAVRFGGGPCSGLPWRWGYGYPGCSVLLGADSAIAGPDEPDE